MCEHVFDRIFRVMVALLMAAVVGSALLGLASPALAGCASCQGIAGLGVEMRDGTTWAVPVADGWDLGPGGPGRSDPKTLPQGGGPRNFGTANAPNIKMPSGMVITVDSGNVLVDGVQKPLWSWNSTTRTLVAPGGYTYVFNSSGFVTSISGADGQRITSFTYDTTHASQISTVTDSFGNVWTYGVPTGQYDHAPTSVENPDHTKKIEFSYKPSDTKPSDTNGAGQYDVVTAKKWDSANWVEERHSDYSYDASNRITQVSTSVPNYQDETSTTIISYYSSDQGGRTTPVQRICNEKLQMDTMYSYSTEPITQNGTEYTYGVTNVRRRETYGSDTESKDQVAKYYYYRGASGKDAELFRVVRQQYNGSSWQDYSTVEYRCYGYNGRFSDAPQSDPPSLKGQTWKTVDARNNTTAYEYSTENGMVARVTLPSTNQINYSYLQDGGSDTAFVQQIIDARGKYTRYTRDATHKSQITKVEVSSDGSTWSTVKDMAYYSTPSQKAGLLHTVTVPSIGDGSEDMVTTFDYEDLIASTTNYRAQPTKQEYAWYNGSTYEPKSTTASFYADGRTRWDKDALENQSDYTYDDEARLTTTLSPADSGDSGTVDSDTSTTITDTGKTWYDNQLAGMVLTIEAGASAGKYVILGNSADTITVASGVDNAASNTYTVRPHSDLSYTSCCGQVDEETDSTGRKTYYDYDDQGRVWKIRNSETGSSSNYPLVQYSYNDLGQKTEVKTYKDSSDSTGRATSYAYDQMGRVIRIVYPTNGGTALLWDEYYQYDKNDNLVAKLVGTVDGSGNKTAGSITAYAYDELNRLVKADYGYSSSVWPVSADSNGDISITSPDVQYQYDGGSDLKTQMTDASGTSYYTYDEHGWLETYIPPLPANYTVGYAYNAAGEKTSVTVRESGTEKYQTAYTYFKNGWLKQVKGQKYVSPNWSAVTQVDFEYDAVGNLTRRKNNGTSDIQTEYAYNARSEATRIDHKASGTSKYKLDYRRDGAGTPLQISFDGNSFAKAYTNGNIVRYGYDPAGRLSGQTWGHEDGGWQQDNADTWDYDWVGNRDPASNYNQVDELSGYQYDMLGNVEYDPSSGASEHTRYHYNADNLLSQVDYVNGGTTTTTAMTWDGDQDRVKIASGSNTWEMVYDTAAGTPAVLLAKNTVSSTTTYEYYMRGLDGSLLASFTDGATPTPHYYHFDQLGSMVLLTNGSGAGIGKTYDAWGNRIDGGASTSSPYQYVGELGYYTHTSTQGTALSGLLQLGVRFYDPELGRFTQRDRIPVWGDNAYVYAGDCPLTFIDPMGLQVQATAASTKKRNTDPCVPGDCFNCQGCTDQYRPKAAKICKANGKCKEAWNAIENNCDSSNCNPVTNRGKDFVKCMEDGLKIVKKMMQIK